MSAAFTLPPGSFATVLMRELMKNDEPASSDAPTTSGEPGTAEEPNPIIRGSAARH